MSEPTLHPTRRAQSIVGIFRHRTFLTLLLVVAAMITWQFLAPLYGEAKCDPQLRAKLAEGVARVDVAVVLRFPPEEFHVRFFQDFGVITGVDGDAVLLRRVAAEDVITLAKQYWVAAVKLL